MGAVSPDKANPITQVLDPGEQLLWIGRPKGSSVQPTTRYLPWIALALGCFFERLAAYTLLPLSPLNHVEFFILGPLFLTPLWLLHRADRDTTYAVTSQRLLISTGPGRKQVRQLTFADLGSVRVTYRKQYGTILDFAKRGPAAASHAWSFLDSGEPDKWFTPWTVDDPESLQQLIKAANDRYWFDTPTD